MGRLRPLLLSNHLLPQILKFVTFALKHLGLVLCMLSLFTSVSQSTFVEVPDSFILNYVEV